MQVSDGKDYISYETYDCVLPACPITANSHNFQTNFNLKSLYTTVNYCI